MATPLVASTDEGLVERELRGSTVMGAQIAVHREPVWQARADFLVHCDLSHDGMPGRREQLWCRKISESTLEICCIPFFAYGLALGDCVEFRASRDGDLLVGRVTRPSGHWVLRIALSDDTRLETLHTAIHERLVLGGFLHEWHATGYVAVDLQSDDQERQLTSFLGPYFTAGRLVFEIDHAELPQ